MRVTVRRLWRRYSRGLWGTAVALLILGALFFGLAPRLVDMRMNAVSGTPLPPVSAEARSIHGSVPVVDLHNDLLLWSRNPERRYERGHSDLPRLRQGRVRVQVFSAVIRTPYGQNYERNAAGSDRQLPLLIAQAWPPATWGSDYERAVYQALRLHRQEGEKLTIVRTRADLADVLHGSESGPLGALLAIEGMHALEGDLGNLPRLFNLGYRIFGLVHFFDNKLGGSAHGREQGGLTEFGRRAVRWIERHGGIVDLAHASPVLVDDVLRVASQPVIVSHTGVQATCPGPRNLSDDQLRRIGDTEGLVGIGFWPGAVCGEDIDSIARAIRHAVEVAGVDAVALGSDFDGATRVPFDAGGLASLTQALLDAGLPYDHVQAVLGRNAARVLQELLPQ